MTSLFHNRTANAHLQLSRSQSCSRSPLILTRPFPIFLLIDHNSPQRIYQKHKPHSPQPDGVALPLSCISGLCCRAVGWHLCHATTPAPGRREAPKARDTTSSNTHEPRNICPILAATPGKPVCQRENYTPWEERFLTGFSLSNLCGGLVDLGRSHGNRRTNIWNCTREDTRQQAID